MSHPYVQHENTPLWVLVDQELAELEANGDVQLVTRREYVVGALCERIAPLYGWHPSGALTAWRTLRAADWPSQASETERYEIAMGIAGVVESGTAEHVADALRAFIQDRDGRTQTAEELLPLARLLMAAESSDDTAPGAERSA